MSRSFIYPEPVVRIDFLCLANSYKEKFKGSRKVKGRCVAGLRMDTMEWVRLVSDTEDGALFEDETRLDVGRTIRPLDLVSLELLEPRPRAHQPENWLTGPAWNFQQSLPTQEAAASIDEALARYPQPPIKANPRVRELGPSRTLQRSLRAERVNSPSFSREADPTRDGSPWRWRCRFSAGETACDFSFTDPALRDKVKRGNGRIPNPEGRWYLTLSLTEPFNGDYFKIVAGAFKVSER